jgi:hypothetical protein
VDVASAQLLVLPPEPFGLNSVALLLLTHLEPEPINRGSQFLNFLVLTALVLALRHLGEFLFQKHSVTPHVSFLPLHLLLEVSSLLLKSHLSIACTILHTPSSSGLTHLQL